MAYVYQHITLTSKEIFYIGISANDIQRCTSKNSRNDDWHDIVYLCGYKTEIIFENLTWKEACKKEKELINLHGRKDIGKGCLVNHTDGGEGLHNPSIKIRNLYKQLYSNKTFIERFGKEKAKMIGEKITKTNKGQKRPKQSESMKGKYIGENNPMYGKTCSEIERERKRQAFLTKNPGKNKSEATKKLISDNRKGIASPFKNVERKIIICPYCDKRGGEGIMQRWHFENCKLKNIK